MVADALPLGDPAGRGGQPESDASSDEEEQMPMFSEMVIYWAQMQSQMGVFRLNATEYAVARWDRRTGQINVS